MTIPLWTGSPSSISISSQIDSGVCSNVSLSCQHSGFDSLERFGECPSKGVVSNSSSFCHSCACDRLHYCFRCSRLLYKNFKSFVFYFLFGGIVLRYWVRFCYCLNSCFSVNICKRGRLRIHLLYWLSNPLIIRLFPLNSLTWLSRISDTSENKSERFDSDNQINTSRLISYLDFKSTRWIP